MVKAAPASMRAPSRLSTPPACTLTAPLPAILPRRFAVLREAATFRSRSRSTMSIAPLPAFRMLPFSLSRRRPDIRMRPLGAPISKRPEPLSMSPSTASVNISWTLTRPERLKNPRPAIALRPFSAIRCPASLKTSDDASSTSVFPLSRPPRLSNVPTPSSMSAFVAIRPPSVFFNALRTLIFVSSCPAFWSLPAVLSNACASSERASLASMRPL